MMADSVGSKGEHSAAPSPERSVARREFSRAQKVALIKRAMNGAGRIICEGCGLNITGKAIEFDHIIPEALILDKSTALSLTDGLVLGRDCCHRRPGGKTATDLADIAEAKRREAKHLGIPRNRGFLGSSFSPAQPQRSASRPLTKPAAWRCDTE
jgi:hypothetical protein